MLGWWKALRRRRVLGSPEPKLLRDSLQNSIWQFEFLPSELQDRIANWCRVFIAEKYWEGCGGFHIDDEVRYCIAGQASLLTLAYPNWFFDSLQTILIYPRAYIAPDQPTPIGSGVAVHGDSHREGEAWYRGPVILNWRDAIQSGLGPNDGHSLVVHEFAHLIDMVNDRTADGLPPLPVTISEEQWHRQLRREMELARESAREGLPVLFSHYGLTSLSEFFAVSSELYFQLPHELAEYHTHVFRLLLDFYQVDLRDWVRR